MHPATWVHTFHLTLRFMGEVDCRLFDDICDALTQLHMPPFSLTLQGIGFFPPRKQPKVLWVGVQKNERLMQLKKKVDYQLGQLGLPQEKRKFHPHVTLARLHHPSEEEIGRYLAQHSLFKVPPFEINQFHLFSSSLSRQGAVHTKESSYGLERPAKELPHSVDNPRHR